MKTYLIYFLRPIKHLSLVSLFALILDFFLVIVFAQEVRVNRVNKETLTSTVTNSNSNSNSTFNSVWDSYGEDFLQGNPLILKAPVEAGVKPAVIEKIPLKPKLLDVKNEVADSNQDTRVSVKWLRKNYVLLEERAIDNPSTPNVEAYLYAKRIILDKAQNFSSKVDEITKSDPFLNENNRIPYASSGATSIRNTNLLAQQDALKQMALVGGVYIFIDGQCIFCAQQLPVLSFLRESYGLQSWVISVDGTAPAGYKGQVSKDNGLYKKLGLKLTPSIVYISHPKAYTGGDDPNNYFIISQGYYAADELTKVMAYAAYRSNLVSEATRRSLNIWDRGLASIEDLNSLRLDVNQPESFRLKLQPLLEKSYK